MRRPRRHRWLTVSVVLFAYSAFQAVLSSGITPDALDATPEETKTENHGKGGIFSTLEILRRSTRELESSEESKRPMKGLEEDEEAKKMIGDGYEENESTAKIRKEEFSEEEYGIPTLRPPRSCTPPAIEQFPRPLMGQNARKHGGLILHILVAVYTFIGLAIVCNKYFVPSVGRICEELRLAPDVAGATFMAAGSSAPKLATVVIGVFCAQDDIGVSGVIGSAVFKIMFVISVCALCAGTVSHLNWWPLCRDCFFYVISIFVMLYTITNGYVSWREALFLLMMYVMYCIALHFKLLTRKKQAALVTYKKAGGAAAGGAASGAAGGEQYSVEGGHTRETPLDDPARADGAGDACDNADGGRVAAAPLARERDTGRACNDPVIPEYYKAKEYNPETAIDPLVKPIGANALQMACWYVALPVHWTCRKTMPDCRGRWYPVTFLISMLWISFYSYFMVWMITIIGDTLGVPGSVMGLTFVPAGLSVPDALSSLAVIKQGYGDMAVSNAVGSNVFDILVCLGLPWFIQTAIIQPGSHVNVISKGLIYTTLSLLSTVLFLVVATCANCWKLDRKYGAVLMLWYLLFITLASLHELNVFGDIHPPDCMSFY